MRVQDDVRAAPAERGGQGAGRPRGTGPRARLGAAFENERPFGWLLSAPGLLLLLVTTTVPLLYLTGASLFHYDLTAPEATRFVGLGNYVDVLGDGRFWRALWLSAIYTVSTVTAQVVIGLALALVVDKITVGRGVIRVASILPIMFAPVVVGLVWSTLLLTPDYGIVDFLVRWLGLGSYQWLGDPTLALVSVIVMHTWQWTPFAFLIFLATLATFPQDVKEAALLDCTNAFQRFWHITLPLLRPAIVVVIILRTVIALSAFDAIFAATGGGPGTATEILNIYVYRTTFQEFSIGYGSALAVVLLFVTLLIAVFFSRLRRAR